MTPFVKYALFVLLGAAVGAGAASAVLIEQADRLREQLRYTQNARDSAQQMAQTCMAEEYRPNAQ